MGLSKFFARFTLGCETFVLNKCIEMPNKDYKYCNTYFSDSRDIGYEFWELSGDRE
jgi:hypothetical protein